MKTRKQCYVEADWAQDFPSSLDPRSSWGLGSALLHFQIGLTHIFRKGRGTGLLAVQFIVMAFVTGLSIQLFLLATSAINNHLSASGLNRITVTRTGDEGLLLSDCDKIQAIGLGRVVPEITTVIQISSPDSGRKLPFLASSYQTEDPMVVEMSMIAKFSNPAGAIISSDTLRRLGLPLASRKPPVLSIIHEAEDLPTPVSSVTGDLGDFGIRLPWPLMVKIRQSQLNLENASEVEINRIHVLLPQNQPIEAAIDQLRQLEGDFQFRSPWFERAGQRELAVAAVQTASPILAIVLIFSLITATLLTLQQLRAEAASIAHATLMGASLGQSLLWAMAPKIVVAVSASFLGLALAKSVTYLPLLTKVKEQCKVTDFSLLELVIFAGIAFGLPLVIQGLPLSRLLIKTSDLEKLLAR